MGVLTGSLFPLSDDRTLGLVRHIYGPIVCGGSPSMPRPLLQRSRMLHCAASPSTLQEHNTNGAVCANRGQQLRNQDI